ncbi:alpha/beta-hydrolase [Lojkania enalia]|uniref:Alpha/beta-hydrolase n=1 Tax=Lojkania enalia TaxID=147567 RepID=A0A9P4K567_9PLEO|nr:alpha/beta-hydrolase [Didymosphaeria enalia]
MSKTSNYPKPLIIPSPAAHKQTIIILHGRGSTAEKFAEPLLTHPVSSTTSPTSLDISPNTESTDTKTFQSYFSNTKFIFPTASLRRAVAYNRSLIHQWFDMFPLDAYPPEHKQNIQVKGLRESVKYVHGLLDEACKEVGGQNVVLMGLSQGCATGLVSLLLWKGEKLGGFVGMCGWCAFRERMLDAIVDVENGEGNDDVFERSGEEIVEERKSKLEKAVEWLKEELEFENESRGSEVPLRDIPVFLSHGMEDERVPFKLGKLVAGILKDVGVDVTWSEYEGLGHWYSADMLKDIVQFVKGLED